MRYWLFFWTLSALTAGLSFALITIVVTVKGGRDLRDLFRGLIEQKTKQSDDSVGG